jgi:hypothetical protein
MRLISLLAVLVLAGCLTTGSQQLVVACRTAASTLVSLTVLKAQGKLSPTQIAAIDGAVVTIDPLCGSDTPPDVKTALATVERQLFIMNGIKQ